MVEDAGERSSAIAIASFSVLHLILSKQPEMNKYCRLARWLESAFTAVGQPLGSTNKGSSCATKSWVFLSLP